MFLQMGAPCRGGLEIGATLRGDNLIKMKHIIPIYGIDELIVWVVWRWSKATQIKART